MLMRIPKSRRSPTSGSDPRRPASTGPVTTLPVGPQVGREPLRYTARCKPVLENSYARAPRSTNWSLKRSAYVLKPFDFNSSYFLDSVFVDNILFWRPSGSKRFFEYCANVFFSFFSEMYIRYTMFYTNVFILFFSFVLNMCGRKKPQEAIKRVNR